MATKSEGSAVTAELTETEKRNLRSVADVLPYWNSHDVDGVLSFYSEQIRWRNVAMEETYQGKAAVRRYLTELISAFPDLSFEVTHKIARGDNVAEQWFIRGTHLGEFAGVPPTGRPVVIPGMSMVELKDGRFVSDQFYFDSGIILRQMGLMPPLATLQTPVGRVALWLAVNRARAAAAAGLVLAAVVIGRRRRRSRSGR